MKRTAAGSIISILLIVVSFTVFFAVNSMGKDPLTYVMQREKGTTNYIFFDGDKKLADAKFVWVDGEVNANLYINIKGKIKDGTYINKKDGKSAISFKNGRREGKFTEYYPSGQLKDDRQYKKGMPIGTHTSYSPDGTVKQVSTYSAEGPARRKDYYPDGSVRAEREENVKYSESAGTQQLSFTITNVKTYSK